MGVGGSFKSSLQREPTAPLFLLSLSALRREG
jgi:hypothetical protein